MAASGNQRPRAPPADGRLSTSSGVAGNTTLVVALAAGFGVAVALLLVFVVIVLIHRKRRFARASGPGFPMPLIVR
jgi:hypothetical protein